MKTNSFIFAAVIAFALALTFSCSSDDSSNAGDSSSSSGVVSSSSVVAGNSSSSSGDAVSSSSSSVVAGDSSSSLGDAVPSSSSSVAASSSSSISSSSSNAVSSSSIVAGNMCGTTPYDKSDPNYRCIENSVLEAKCGTTIWYWYDVANFRCGENNVLEGKCGESWYSALNQRCGAGSIIETKCGDDWFDATDETLRCRTDVVESKCGDRWYEWHHSLIFECHDGIVEDKCGDGFYNPVMEYCSNGVIKAYGSVKDKDGNTYKTVKIGEQTWMAENLYTEPKSGSSACLNGLVSNCKKYGRYYNMWTAMDLKTDCHLTTPLNNYCGPISAKHQGICPDGWHLPDNDEWNELFDNVGGYMVAGKHLKAVEGWIDQNGHNVCGPAGSTSEYILYSCEDTYGFSAIRAGCYFGSGSSYLNPNGSSSRAIWWSSTAFSASLTYYVYVIANTDRIYLTNPGLGSSGDHFSVRCVQD